MSEKLTDPNKAAHETVEVRADGDAVRNDGMVLQAANKNPWYVLATIYGEQAEDADIWSRDEELAVKNCRAWNGWACSTLDDDERKARTEATGLTPEDLAPHSKAELTALRKKLRARLGDDTAELPEPTENINFLKKISLSFPRRSVVLPFSVHRRSVVLPFSARPSSNPPHGLRMCSF